MEMLTATLVVSYVLSPASCQTSSLREIDGEAVFARVMKTVTYTSESFHLLLEMVGSLNVLSNRIQTHELQSDNIYDLRSAKIMNVELFNYLEYLYNRVKPLVEWDKLDILPVVAREWEHVENYSKVLREAMLLIYRQAVNKDVPSVSDEDGDSCLLMPVGPPRVFQIVESGQTRPKRKAVTERNNLKELLNNIEEALNANSIIVEQIALNMLCITTIHLDDEDEIVKNVKLSLEEFRNYVLRLIADASASKNLFVDESMVQKSKSLTTLVLSIRDTLVAMDVRADSDS